VAVSDIHRVAVIGSLSHMHMKKADRKKETESRQPEHSVHVLSVLIDFWPPTNVVVRDSQWQSERQFDSRKQCVMLAFVFLKLFAGA